MAISQEGRVVVSWWLRANRWGKNLLEEEGGGKATIASVSRIQRRNHIQNQTEGNGVLPAGTPSVPYHASSSLSRDSNLKSPHSASSLVFFFSWIFFFFGGFFSNRLTFSVPLLDRASRESLQLSRTEFREWNFRESSFWLSLWIIWRWVWLK